MWENEFKCIVVECRGYAIVDRELFFHILVKLFLITFREGIQKRRETYKFIKWSGLHLDKEI